MPDVAREIPIDPLGLSREKVADWVFPHYVRADILALHYQRWFLWLSQLIFGLAAGAVVVVALQVTIWPQHDWVVDFEVFFLGLLLVILGMNRRLRLHDQWISSRFLAERLRSSYFLALAGTGDQRETGDQRGRSPRIAFFSDSSEAWIERALSEAIACRPHLNAGSVPLDVLRDYLKRHWVEGQISYQTRRSGQLRAIRSMAGLDSQRPLRGDLHRRGCAQHRELHLHRAGGLEKGSLDNLHHLPCHWRGSPRIRCPAPVPPQLRALPDHGRRAGSGTDRHVPRPPSSKQVQEVARETERVMREENSDWFGVMRFHDIELIT